MSGNDRPPRPPEAPYLGVGVGLRPVHYPEILARLDAGRVGVDWFEVLSENYLAPGGRPRRVLRDLRDRVPLVLHGVSLNIGSTDPLRDDYLSALAELASYTRARWISDHLCWTGVGGHNLHDLIPLPYTREAIDHVAGRIASVQDRLGRRIAIENASTYLSFCDDGMPEWEFVCEIVERADCGILLDVNNVFVSATNHGFAAEDYVDAIPGERVFQIHLAGHSDNGTLLIDTHDHPVRDEVWALFERTMARIGPVSTLIEWDDHIPVYDVLLGEADRARAILERTAPELRVEPAAARG